MVVQLPSLSAQLHHLLSCSKFLKVSCQSCNSTSSLPHNTCSSHGGYTDPLMCSFKLQLPERYLLLFLINTFEILESLFFLQNPEAIVEVSGWPVDLPPF